MTEDRKPMDKRQGLRPLEDRELRSLEVGKAGRKAKGDGRPLRSDEISK